MDAPEPFDLETSARGFTATWRRIVTEPRAFFADMPEVGGLREPFVFLTACAVIDGLGRGLVTLSLGALVWTAVGGVVGGVALATLLVLVAQHLLDGRAGFEPTFRAAAYATAPVTLAWVPRLGVLALVWTWYLTVRGIERVQGFDAPRAVLSVVIAVGILALVTASLAGGPLLASLR